MTGAGPGGGLRRTLRAPFEWAAYAFLTPSWLLIALLAAMMLTPPSLPQPPPVDRAIFAVLVLVGGLYVLFRPKSVNWREPLIWALVALAALAVMTALRQPQGRETWSILASRYVIPATVFVVGACALRSGAALRRVFLFLLCVQGYLIAVSLASLLGADWLLFPRYISDIRLGTHAGRARGPFLQAVANGTALSLLGLCAFYAYLRGLWRGWSLALLVLTPVAVFATMTRGVWVAFLAAVLVLWGSRTSDARVRTMTFLFAIVAGAAAIGLLTVPELSERAFTRTVNEETVDLRIGLYQASIDMFLERPWLGRGVGTVSEQIGPYLVKYGFNPDQISPHNTYLEILVEQGLLGLLLYLFVFLRLFLLGSRLPPRAGGDEPIDRRFRAFWRAALTIYLVNGMFVVMTYDFINALLFLLAGAMAGSEWRARSAPPVKTLAAGDLRVVGLQQRAIR